MKSHLSTQRSVSKVTLCEVKYTRAVTRISCKTHEIEVANFYPRFTRKLLIFTIILKILFILN